MGCGSSTANTEHPAVSTVSKSTAPNKAAAAKRETPTAVDTPAAPGETSAAPAEVPVAAPEPEPAAPEPEPAPEEEPPATEPEPAPEEEAPAPEEEPPAAEPAPAPEESAPPDSAAEPEAAAAPEPYSSPEEIDALRQAVLQALGESKDAATVQAAIEANPGICTLDLSNQGLDLEAGLAVVDAVKLSSSVRHLLLSGNKIESEDDRIAGAIASLLKENKQLQELDIAGIGLGPMGANLVAMSVAANTSLLNLTLDGNPGMGDDGASVIGAGVNANSVLSHLSIANSALSDEGVGYIAAALCSNASIQYLNLSGNAIGVEGAKELASVLTAAVGGGLPWVLLDLSGNSNIGDAGVAHLADALSDDNASLQQLVLRNCGVGDDGAVALGEVAAESSLLKLDLTDNGGIRDKGREALAAFKKTEVLL